MEQPIRALDPRPPRDPRSIPLSRQAFEPRISRIVVGKPLGDKVRRDGFRTGSPGFRPLFHLSLIRPECVDHPAAGLCGRGPAPSAIRTAAVRVRGAQASAQAPWLALLGTVWKPSLPSGEPCSVVKQAQTS